MVEDPQEAKDRRRHLAGIVGREVKSSRVLGAIGEVPRHAFAATHSLEEAYEDRPLSIGYGQTISQPTVVAMMSDALELEGHERILEIGTGSGYQAAVLARLGGHVDTIEVVAELAARASATLREVGCANVDVHVGDGWKGLPAGAPFDRIVVTAAPEVLPQALVEQLADGGLLVVPLGSQRADQRLLRWWKTEGHLREQDLGAVRFVPMVHP